MPIWKSDLRYPILWCGRKNKLRKSACFANHKTYMEIWEISMSGMMTYTQVLFHSICAAGKYRWWTYSKHEMFEKTKPYRLFKILQWSFTPTEYASHLPDIIYLMTAEPCKFHRLQCLHEHLLLPEQNKTCKKL